MKEMHKASLLPPRTVFILFDAALKQNCQNYFDLNDSSKQSDIPTR